jgi:hypothetical protein
MLRFSLLPQTDYETASQWHPDDPGDPNRNVDALTRLRNFAAQRATKPEPQDAPVNTEPDRPMSRPDPRRDGPRLQ